MSDARIEAARYPLRAVMRRTGLSADVLRAWERRYGAIHPDRSEGGQRLYSEADVERLVLLQRATAAGNSISEIAQLDRAALEALLERPHRSRPPRVVPSTDSALRDSLAATAALDQTALEASLKRAALAVGTEAFVDELLPRFLETVGDRWHRGSITPAHEHLATQTVRRVLGWVADAYDAASDAPTLVVATPAAEMHELGAMLVSAAAASEGWRVLYLGANLPAADIVAAAVQVRASAVALSLVYSDGEATLRELRETAAGLPDETLLITGGVAAARLARSLDDPRIRVLSDLDELRSALRVRRSERAAIAAD
jgi:DNA-binding transcriptional MerR regulator/methylmalonyl-CoA mutase cobalamin-binding subunit